MSTVAQFPKPVEAYVSYRLRCFKCGLTAGFVTENAAQNKATAHRLVTGHLDMRLVKVSETELGLELR